MENDNKYIKLENKEPFQVLVITPNKIQDRDWMAPDYLNKLLTESFCKYETINPVDYVEKIAVFLEVNKYTYPDIKVTVISEEMDYIDEIMYIDLFPEYKIDSNVNEFATLLNINGDIIYGNVIVSRTYIPSNDNLYKNNTNMSYSDVNCNNMERMLDRRANTTVITYNSDEETLCETNVFGPLDKFADLFFGEACYTYKKKELGFLKHNINIWYSENKYGNLDVFGNILPELARIDKMIVFTMWTDTYRGNISLDEFNKIKYLSKVLNNFSTPEELEKETIDHINRLVVKNKYRILNTIYNEYKK